MPYVSLVGESQAGGVISGPGEPAWTIFNKPISLLGDGVSGHGPSPHNGPTMIEGSSWMTINDIPVVREGNAASCGHTADGNPWFELPM